MTTWRKLGLMRRWIVDMLKRILNCKMYRSSTRQSSILAAFQDPINKELVTQISNYLDEEDVAEIVEDTNQDPENRIVDVTNIVSENSEEDLEDAANDEGDDSVNIADIIDSNKPTGNEDDIDDSIEDNKDLDDNSDEDENVSVEESLKSKGDKITASVACTNIQIPKIANEVKGLLNLSQDTAGVARVTYQLASNEFWVYYEDKINLNNVMNQVIDLLNAAGYTYLQFNRLARTDNAIVFQFDAITSQMIVSNISKNEKE